MGYISYQRKKKKKNLFDMIVLIYADGISNCCWIIIFYVIHISFIPKCLIPKCFIPKCFIPKCLRILEYLSFEVILKHSIIIYGPSLYNQYKIMTILRVFEFLAQGNNGSLLIRVEPKTDRLQVRPYPVHHTTLPLWSYRY